MMACELIGGLVSGVNIGQLNLHGLSLSGVLDQLKATLSNLSILLTVD
jgi:hypothetical protein